MPDIPAPPIDDALLYRQTRDAVRCVLHCGDPDPNNPGLADRIIAALEALPMNQRVIIVMNLGNDVTQLTIAEWRGISERTVQSTIYEGIKVIAARVF